MRARLHARRSLQRPHVVPTRHPHASACRQRLSQRKSSVEVLVSGTRRAMDLRVLGSRRLESMSEASCRDCNVDVAGCFREQDSVGTEAEAVGGCTSCGEWVTGFRGGTVGGNGVGDIAAGRWKRRCWYGAVVDAAGQIQECRMRPRCRRRCCCEIGLDLDCQLLKFSNHSSGADINLHHAGSDHTTEDNISCIQQLTHFNSCGYRDL